MESFKPKIEAEDPQQEIIDDLETFVKGNEMSTEDLRIAYLISLDLPMSDIGYEINEKRENLAEKLRDCFDKGLTINRVPELISQREQKENIIFNR